MGFCADRSVNYLKSLQLNTIRHPREGIEPLMLVGQFGDSTGIIGSLDQLIESPTNTLPEIRQLDGSDITGKRTSKLPISLGLDIFGSIIGGLGGNLGVKASYEIANTVEFKFLNVKYSTANVIGIGSYLMSGAVKWDHLVLKKFLEGSGNLYVITQVATSDQFGITAYGSNKASIVIDVPTVESVVGGNIGVGIEDEATNTLSFQGDKQLAFGFAAAELSAVNSRDDELVLDFTPVDPGGVAMAFGQKEYSGQVWFDVPGAMNGLPELSLNTIG